MGKNKQAVQEVLDKLSTEILAGIQHGFFECKVNCEIIQNKKRKVTIKAGKSYQFIIPEQDT